jgi:predicted dithiol-disulfide oxidoreductase (DUF899 family)
MPDHKIGTRQEWLAARRDLLEAEKALTRRSDELAQRRRQLPWVRVDKEFGSSRPAIGCRSAPRTPPRRSRRS